MRKRRERLEGTEKRERGGKGEKDGAKMASNFNR